MQHHSPYTFSYITLFLLNTFKHPQYTMLYMYYFTHLEATPWTNTSSVCLCIQTCLTLCNPMGCSLPGSSVYGISQAGILEWVAISSSRRSLWSRDQTHILCSSRTGRRIHYHQATWEVLLSSLYTGRKKRYREVTWPRSQSKWIRHCSVLGRFVSNSVLFFFIIAVVQSLSCVQLFVTP